MYSFTRGNLGKALALMTLALTLTLLVSACGGTSSGNGNSKITLTVGGKLDTEARLLTTMDVLLLRQAGYTVVDKAGLGTNSIVNAAIQSGAIDMYPEFTATGLALLGLTTTHNAQQDYQAVKQGYESKYHITWLDPAPLDDTYGICTTKAKATALGITKISDIVPLVAAGKDNRIATPPDGQSDPNVLPGLAAPTSYGLKFPATSTTVEDEALTFTTVMNGQADFNICYTTSPLIAADNFVLLTDDKGSFPIYNPATIVRDSTLAKAPGIPGVLNPLAPKLTTAAIIPLNTMVAVDHKSVDEVAATWLRQQGLLH
ncbi:MAG TPA: glycine betaine ABC transporter substrate-binding protein [Ktedonobacterales bacterium]|nr:glycine betaine ABC transporter substrate-binding protein [Ktedonobacterales bacterium]